MEWERSPLLRLKKHSIQGESKHPEGNHPEGEQKEMDTLPLLLKRSGECCLGWRMRLNNPWPWEKAANILRRNKEGWNFSHG